MIGTSISHYNILEKLGEGGMGVVYKAQDTKLDRLVALKFLPPHLAADEKDKQRFINEAKAASALDHPNICTIYEVDETPDGELFLAMAFYRGILLSEQIKRGPLKIEEVVDITIQAAEGLHAAHEKGIVHRDIKSGNIMVTEKGQVKIMDFGLARRGDMTMLTKAGATVGTIPFMSPEQALGEKVDARSDIWSLGVVLYEMLAGALPFRSEYDQALVYLILNEDPKSLSSVRPDVSPEIEKIVTKCLGKKTEDRYQTASELLADLYRMKGVTPPREVTWNLFRKKVRPFMLPAAAIAGLILVVAGYYMLTQPATEGNSLAVMYFENLPDPEDKDHIGAMLANLLITSLSQVKELDVTSREKLYHIQQYLTQSDEGTITPSLATRIAEQAGVRWMVMGTILQKEPNLVVTSRLIDVKSGSIVSSQRPPEMPPDELFTLADSLAHTVMIALRIAPATIVETRPSWQLVTTSSQEAYRAYVEGREGLWKYRFREAQAPLKRAVELDSSFAMAQFFLAGALWYSGDRIGFRKPAEQAWKLREKVTERERLTIEAWYAGVIESDWDKGREINELWVRKYPNDPAPYLPLAAHYAALNQYEKSEKAHLQMLKLDPFAKPGWNNLAYFYAGLGRKKEALEAVNQYVKLAPGEFNPYDTKADIYLAFGDLDSARYWREKAAAFEPGTAVKLAWDALLRQDYTAAERYYQQAGSTTLLFQIALHRGRLMEAEQQMKKLERSSQLPWLIWTSHERANYPTMVKYTQEMSGILKEDPADKVYGRDLLALALLKNGNSKRAYELLEEVKKDISKVNHPSLQSQYEYALGLLALEEVKYDVALKQFDAAFEFAYPNRSGQFHYGVALLKVGRVADAIKELQKASWTRPSSFHGVQDFIATERYWLFGAVKAHYWLAVAYEEQGNKRNPVKEYETFLDIWKDADFDAPELKDAKARLAKLK